MPQILELREIEGQIWARLAIDLNATPQPVSLLTAPEVEHLKQDAAKAEAETFGAAIDKVRAEVGAGYGWGAWNKDEFEMAERVFAMINKELRS